jgi:membrane-associated phospholipid phosphatase
VNLRIGVYWVWALSFLACAIVALFSLAYFDVPVARWAFQNIGRMAVLGQGLGSAVLMSFEAATIVTLVIIRLVRGYLSQLGKVTVLACLTSLCAYAFDNGVLKVFFGVPTPYDVIAENAHHAFHVFAGSPNSSFPSGHMALAGAFAGVFMELYPTSIGLFSALLAFAAALLVVGDWHFISDVTAGAFVGVSAGLLAGQLWRVHSR